MSIIVAIASKKNGVVASDSQIFLPAEFDKNNVRVKDATPDPEPLDKTFALRGAGIIGAFAGLVKFSGKTVSEHATEIFAEKQTGGSGLKDVAEFLAEKMSGRVANIETKEVLFRFRIIDLLLAGKSGGKKSDVTIAKIAIHPQDGAIVFHISFSVIDPAPFVYWTVGDESACRAASNCLCQNTSRDDSLRHMKFLARNAVRQGVEEAGPYPHGEGKSCGGEPRLKCL